MSRLIRSTKSPTMSLLIYWIPVIFALVTFLVNVIFPLSMVVVAIVSKQYLPFLIATLFVLVWLAVSFGFLFAFYVAAFESKPEHAFILPSYWATGLVFFVALKIIQGWVT